MGKETLNTLLKRYTNVNVDYNGYRKKIRDINTPYKFSDALRLDVVKQLLINMSNEKFLDLISQSSNYPDTCFLNTIYLIEDNDPNKHFINYEIKELNKWINDCPIHTNKELYKEQLIELYIKNTFINTDDFLSWIKNRTDNIKRDFEIINNEYLQSRETYCWYTQKLLDDINYFDNIYKPREVERYINENLPQMHNFFQNVIDIRNQSTSLDNLVQNIIDRYKEIFDKNISNSLLGFLVHPSSEDALSSSTCNAYGKRLKNV